MRIAVYHNLPSGGAKRALYEMTRRLAARHAIDVYTLSTGDHAFCDLRPVVDQHRIYPFEPARLFNSPFGRLNQWQRARDLNRLDAVSRMIAAEIDANDYDVVFVHHCRFTQAPLLLRYLETPSVYYCQESLRQLYEPPISHPDLNGKGWRGRGDRLDPLIRIYRGRLRAADAAAARAAGTILANSHFSKGNIERSYGRSAHVAYLGVDADLFSPDPLVEREDYVLSVGALRPNKGFDFLIDALALIPPSERPMLRIIANAGDGAEQGFLETRAAAAGVRLGIETAVPPETLLDRYRRALLIVYAPVREPFGFVPLEAMACRMAVVAVAEGGVLETVCDGQTGTLTPRDPARFAAAVAALLASPETAEAYGRAGRRVVEREWNWEAAVARVERHLAEAAGLTAVAAEREELGA